MSFFEVRPIRLPPDRTRPWPWPDLVEENRSLRSELDKTKAELELVTHERDAALLRLAELGEDL